MSSVYTNLYFNQPIVVLDTTAATPTSGSLVLYGGITANGNALLSTTNISGITTITNATQSTDMSNGALIVTGGVAIQKNLNVGGDVFIAGTLTAGSFATDNINEIRITTGSLLVKTNITAGQLDAINSTIANLVVTSLSSGILNLSIGMTAGILLATAGTFNTVTTSVLSATNITATNMSLSGDLFVGGTLTTVNITTTNLIDTNFSAGIAHVAENLAAIGNSNTIGNIFTTGGNVGINVQSPMYLLDVNGDAQVSSGLTSGSLNVVGNSVLNGNVTTGAINVTGESNLHGNVTTGALFVTGGSLLQGSLGVTGATLLQGDLTVTGASILNAGVTSGALFVTGGSLLQGSLGVTGGVTMRSDLMVSGASIFNAGATTGALFVTGGSLLKGSVGITGGVTMRSDLMVSGASVLNAGVTTGALFVTGGSLLQGSFTVSGASVLNAGVTAGALFITGGSVLQGSLGVSGATLLGNDLTVTGASILNVGVTAGALNVTGNSLLNGMVTAGALFVTGESTLLSNVTMGSNVVIVGPSFQIPIGNISTRPATPLDGYVRYNTETQQFEGYGPGSAWGSLGGVVDIAQTTKVLASASPSTTDGNLYFYTVGNERMRVNSAGNIGIGTSAPNYTLEVNGTLGVSIGLTTGSILSTSVSTGQLNVANSTITNSVFTNVSSGTINVNGLTCGSAYISTGTITNMLNSNITTGTLVANTIDITPSLGDISKELQFSAKNNQQIEEDITGFAFSNLIVRSFNAIVSVSIMKSSGSNLYANYDLRAIQKDTGEWVLNVSFVGDNTGIIFGITNVNSKGQIQYISNNEDNWVSSTIKFRANTTSV